jgi:hypothetical protein
MLTEIAISLGTKVFHSRSFQFFGTNRIPPQHVSHPGLCDLADLAVEQLNLKVPTFSSWTPNIPSSYGAVVQQLAVSTASPRRITRKRVTSYRHHWRWTELALQVFIISSLFFFAIVAW